MKCHWTSDMSGRDSSSCRSFACSSCGRLSAKLLCPAEYASSMASNGWNLETATNFTVAGSSECKLLIVFEIIFDYRRFFCCFCICSCILCASSRRICHFDFFFGLIEAAAIAALTLSSVTTYLRMYHVIAIVMRLERR